MERKKIFLPVLLFALVGLFAMHQVLINLFNGIYFDESDDDSSMQDVEHLKSINDKIEKGETLFSIFEKYGLNIEDLFKMRKVAASIHPLSDILPGKSYNFTLSDENNINSFTYRIDDSTILKIKRANGCFLACKYDIPYEIHVLTIGGSIQDTLISAFGNEREDYLLALQAADILAWDIDFNTDIRTGDTFRIIVEGLYLNGEFKKYGRILSIEFINNNQNYNAYLFEHEGRTGYYSKDGQSLRKAFLKAPLSFRRISSSFSRSRLHPILKVRRPHHGIDYVATKGTPVSAVADGTVIFAGYKHGYGNLIILAHRNNYKTYYGHLSRIPKNIRRGKKIQQGDLIGYVGATGFATGPHLHYEIRMGQIAVNPFKVRNVAGKPVPPKDMTDFKKLTGSMNKVFAMAVFYDTKNIERKSHYLQSALLYASLSPTSKEGGISRN